MDRCRRARTRWMRPGAVALAVVVGVGLSACLPAQPVKTAAGPITSGTRTRLVAPDPTCPRGDGGLAGSRWRWTARVASKARHETLRVDACESPSSALGSQPIDGGPFVIHTDDGDLRGTAKGVLEWDSRDVFQMTLTVTGGSGVYAKARGTLWYRGCVDEAGAATTTVVAGAITATAPAPTLPAACTAP